MLVAAACAAFVVAPAAAQANFTMYYQIDPDTGLRNFWVEGDASSQVLQIFCQGGEVRVDGASFYSNIEGHNLRCNEPDTFLIEGNGGDDHLGTNLMSRAAGFDPAAGCCDAPGAPSDAVAMNGGPGRDTIDGGPFGESINDTNDFNEQGPDTIHGGDGNDEIWGTKNADKIFGDGGADVIHPQLGADVVHGGPGHDAVEEVPFGKDHDVIFGEGGPDQIFAGGGPDRVDGGPGGDYMDGQGGKDRMFGRAGADGLFGGGGADFLFGNAGNDYIRGGPAFDHLFGGPGKDDVRQ
jgi:Ca2+-binding RTX toxin-like protein